MLFLSSHLDPKDAVAPNSAPATCQTEYRYLYCVPGTETYIFFGTVGASLQPASSYAMAINSSIESIKQVVKILGDGPITGGDQYLVTSGTNVQIYAEDANMHHLTWGVYGAALQGLDAWMAAMGNGYSDATFQINDGKNWVGNGYMGAMNEAGICVFADARVPNTTCSATDPLGSVYGPTGGLLC